MLEKKRPEVLRDEDLLELRLFVLDEGAKKKPSPVRVEPQADVVVRVGKISKIHPQALRVEECTHARDGLAIRAELVEEDIDVAAALVGAMMGDRSAPLAAEVVDRDRKSAQLLVDPCAGAK